MRLCAFAYGGNRFCSVRGKSSPDVLRHSARPQKEHVHRDLQHGRQGRDLVFGRLALAGLDMAQKRFRDAHSASKFALRQTDLLAPTSDSGVCGPIHAMPPIRRCSR